MTAPHFHPVPRDTGVTIRLMRPEDVEAADRIFRLAFGTFLGMPDPLQFATGMNYAGTRFAARPTASFVAESNGEVIGSNLAAHWGSVGFFGPITVRPDFWDKGVGSQLMKPVMECFDRWGVRLAGLYTFANSVKHAGLYQRFGFWPRFLTAMMAKEVAHADTAPESLTLSSLPPAEREEMIAACRALTDSLYAGLDLTEEIRTVEKQRLGDVVLLRVESKLAGFAICHCGTGTEAGPETCYAKFAAVRPGAGAEKQFRSLLAGLGGFAHAQALSRVVAGVNTARTAAYATMLDCGYRTHVQGVAMHRPNEAGYSRPECFVLDDWR